MIKFMKKMSSQGIIIRTEKYIIIVCMFQCQENIMLH